MKKIIDNWVHNPGKHCASTALCDLMHYYNIGLSEEMCFGLGAGLGFFYVKGEMFVPTHAIMTRSATLEADFFNNIGIPFAWKIEKDAQKAIEIAEECIAKEIPVLLQTDIYYIDYYKSSSHFNGHVVVQWGFDRENRLAYLSDTHWEGLQELPYSSLEKARSSKFPPILLENNYFEVQKINNDFDIKNAIKLALKKQASDMLANLDDNSYAGIGGMKNASKDMINWDKAKDWKWCTRFSYQVIEKRGTGGGAFRLMYSKFLDESANYIPELRKLNMAQKMLKIAGLWTELSEILKKISELESPEGLDIAGKRLGEIALLEERLYREILNLL